MRLPPLFAAVTLCTLVLAVIATGVALPSAAASPTTGFLSAPTEQLAVPGMAAGAEVTPEGDLYTGWAEYELRFGRRLTAWDQPTRTLPDPGVPLLSSALADGPVRYTRDAVRGSGRRPARGVRDGHGHERLRTTAGGAGGDARSPTPAAVRSAARTAR